MSVCPRVDIRLISVRTCELNQKKKMYGQVYGLLVICSHFMVKALEASCVEMTSSDAVQQEPSCLSCSYEQCAPAECDMKIAYAPR